MTGATYIREPDGAEMIELAPHQYVNRAMLERLGMLLTRMAAPSTRPQRKQHDRPHL